MALHSVLAKVQKALDVSTGYMYSSCARVHAT